MVEAEGTKLPRACEVLVLSMAPLPDRSALKVLGVRVGDMANRPVTFHLNPDDAEEIMLELKKKYEQGSEEDVIIEIDPQYVVPVIRHHGGSDEPVPFAPTT